MKYNKLALTLLGIALVASLSFAALPKTVQVLVQKQLNTVLEDILKNLNLYNETLPEDRVYAHFDKTLYKPGETIWFSAYVRNGASLKASEQSDIIKVELYNPKGAVEKEYKIIAKNGVAKGDFQLDEEAVGGIYKVKIYTHWMRNEKQPAFFEKELTVQKVVLPRLKMKLDFIKKAYGSGDLVAAELSLNDNTNQPLSNYDFKYIVNLQGKKFKEGSGKTGSKGEAMVKFSLPEELTSNDGLLNIMIQYQGQTESISRSVPITLNNIDLALFPEGGDLVAGLKSKVAFKALNEFGKPADIEGVLLNSKGEALTSFASFHQGMGAFSITPQEGEQYTVKITKPVGVKQTFEVPEAMTAGYVLEIRDVDANQVYLTVHSSHDEELYLVGNIRGKKHFATSINAKKGENKTTIPTKFFPIGIAHFTLFDSKGIERAERLAFVNKDKQLNIDIKTDKDKYQPREKVKMTIKVSDERGMPMPADLSVAVVDDQLLTFADDKSSNILSWMLMEADIKDKVEEPNFYFDKNEPKAAQALDYLLMTSGWRRFVWKDIRNGQQPRISYANEQAIIAGTIIDSRSRKPLEGVEVSLERGQYKTITDKDGKYIFKGFDIIGKRPLLMCSKEGYYANSRYLPNYGQHDFYLGENYQYKRQLELAKRKKEARRRPVPKNAAIPVAPMEPEPVLEPEPTDMVLEVEDEAVDLVAVEENEAEVLLENVVEKEVEKVAQARNELQQREVKRRLKEEERRLKKEEKGQSERKKFNKRDRADVVNKPVADKDLDFKNLEIEDEEIEEEIEEVFMVVEEMPIFPGCEDFATSEERKKCTEHKLLEFIDENLKYPSIAKQSNIEGLVVVSFVVDKNGKIKDINCVKDAGGGTGSEAVRVVKNLSFLPEKWTPGKQRARPVPVRYNLPVRFRLSDDREVIKVSAAQVKVQNKRFDRPARKPAPPRNSNVSFYRAREFAAPTYNSNEPVTKRTDFRSTVFWDGHVEIDKKGKAVIEFYNSDAVTSFKITAEGFATDGMIGRAEKRFYTQMPFSLSAKLPVEVVTEDVVKIPLTLINNTKKAISGDLNINYPEGLSPMGNIPTTASLAAGQAKTQYLSFNVTEKGAADKISIAFKSTGFSDEIEKSLAVISKGFPTSMTVSSEEMDYTHLFNVNNIVQGSLEANVTAYPSSLSDMLSGLESMLRQPSGCFEQTSSSTYPNILVLNYLQETGQAKPGITARAKQFIASGYKRLAGYESASGGFEWFGGDPGHEGLTAYGLMEFVDMMKVYDGVDQAMINRTTEWLMKRRDGTGKFKRNPRALHQFGLTDNETMSIYITWALSEANFEDIQTEVDFAYTQAKQTKNPYQLGLAANIMFNQNDQKRGQTLLDELLNIQLDEGAWTHASNHKSAPGSSGKALRIETAALAASAMMKSKNADRMKLKKIIDFIKSNRGSFGGYASTNSTVLALRALVAYAKFSKRADEAGTIEVFVNNQKVEAFDYEKGHDQPIVIKGLDRKMVNGENDIQVKYANTSTPLPYTVAVHYNTSLPNSQEECTVNLQTKIAKTKIKVGETVRLKTTLKNTTNYGQPMTMAIVGLPAGLTAQPWQLKELLDKKTFDFYEVIGNNLVFYYRQMKPSEERVINLDLKADIAGEFAAPASSAYLYYTDEYKNWTAMDRVTIIE